MILGHIKNLQQEKGLFAQALQTGLEYLAKTDFTGMAPGKYEIAGSDIYASPPRWPRRRGRPGR